MEIIKKGANINQQTSPRNEGQQNNSPSSSEGDRQSNIENNSQPMSNMKQDSDEQKAGNREENDR